MKVALLTGAYKNAGDFLIAERAKKLLESSLADAEVIEILRSDIVEQINDINSCDAVVFSGGPIYLNNINSYLKVSDINNMIIPPILILGGGWNGIGGSAALPYKYQFDKKTEDFFRDINNKYGLGCRDTYSLKALRNNGFQNTIMTGCPAWYDLQSVENIDFRNSNNKINKIAISDPALSGHFDFAKQLVIYLKEKYFNSEIVVVFHRGIQRSKNEKSAIDFFEYLQKENIQVVDISESSDGFKVYDSCDLHIGFRVHAHIYNLSIRNKSILIEEDGRGAGVNQTLGLMPIRTYSDTIQFSNKLFHRGIQKIGIGDNKNLVSELNDYLSYLEQTDYIQIQNAFRTMRRCYKNMVGYIQQINKG